MDGMGEEAFVYYIGILKRYYILINLIPSKNNYDHTIYKGDNLLHGIIGTMICCNIGIGGIRSIFLYS